ncbi:MAG: sialidase family protein [Gemmatimonadota bacterium]
MERDTLTQTELFTAGQGGYHTYRIPALLTTPSGIVLAFCEGRRDSRSDSGQIDLLSRRSLDGGLTWSAPQVVATVPGMTCGNPCPVEDAGTGTIWLPFCQNRADGPEGLICEGKAPRTVWLTSSRDGGASWAAPHEITAAAKDPSWTWYATGPGHGIQLASGRLVVPCDHIVGRAFDRKTDPYHSHVILSDDGGRTWRIGGIVPEGTNECAVVEVDDGQALYINCRNYRGAKRRAAAWSRDRGESFSGHSWEEALVEAICQASLTRLTRAGTHDRNRVLFANPASEVRERLTVRLSYDECRSWAVARPLYDGPSAYSDLAVAADAAGDLTILCLYERGADGPYEHLTLARFDVGWLTTGADRVVTS